MAEHTEEEPGEVVGKVSRRFKNIYENLWYIRKFSGTHWSIHALDGDSDFRLRRADLNFFFTSNLSDGQLFIQDNDFYFVKNANTGTRRVEVHAFSHASNYETAIIQNGTWCQLVDQHYGVFTMYNRALYWIKGLFTKSGKIELHRFEAYRDGYAALVDHKVTPFDGADLHNGIFCICTEAPATGWAAEDHLVFIKTQNLAQGKVEIQKWDTSNNSGYEKLRSYVTDYTADDVKNGYFKHSTGTVATPGLYYIKTKNVSNVEIHFLRRSNDYKDGPLAGHVITSLDSSEIVSGSALAVDLKFERRI